MAYPSNRPRRPSIFADTATTARSAQHRLMMLVALLILVLVMLREASRPESWTWLYKLGDSGRVGDPTVHSARPPNQASNRWDRVHLSATLGGDPADAASLADDIASKESSMGHQAEAASEVFIDPQRLSSVRDDTYFRPDERDAWFYIFSRLMLTSAEDLHRHSLGPVSWLQLNQQMEAYRGMVVELRGNVRRAQRVRAPANDIGIQEYWQLWIFEKDGSGTPVVVYALNVPPEFPEASELREEVSLTGVGYKRWSYPAVEGLSLAPVVLANGIRWIRTVPERPTDSSPDDLLWMMVFAVAVAVVVARWVYYWRPRLNRRPRAKAREKESQVRFDFLSPDQGDDE